MSCQRVGYYTGFILFETYPPRVNKCLHLMFKGKTPLCGMVDDSTMAVTLSVHIIVLCTSFMGNIVTKELCKRVGKSSVYVIGMGVKLTKFLFGFCLGDEI